MAIHVRRFELKDVEAIKQLINHIMDVEFREDKAAFPAEDLSDLTRSYGKSGEAFFVAEDGKKLAGTIGVKKEDDRVALIRRIFVSPEYRNKKIGLLLLDQALNFCREAGYRELIFKTTSRMSSANELVQKRGFQSRAKVVLGPLELLKFSMSLEGKSQTA